METETNAAIKETEIKEAETKETEIKETEANAAGIKETEIRETEIRETEIKETGTGLLKRLRENYANLSRGKRKLAEYILNHYDQAAFMTAARLGLTVGVSESTVVRFAFESGFDGYPEFQRELAGLLRKKLHTMERMNEAYGSLKQPEILEHILQTDIKRIEATLQSLDGRAFEQALNILDQAEKIYIVGLRGSGPLASFLHMYLKMVFENVILVQGNSEHELLEQVIYLNGRDAVIGISFPRYSLRTVKLLEFASSRQASVITLTDSVFSPLNLYSSCSLTASSDMASVVDSMVAPMSVINALVTALCLRHRDRVLAYMDMVGQTLDDYQMFGNDEMDIFEECVEMKPFHFQDGGQNE